MADDKPDVKALAWTLASSLLENNHFSTINGSEEVYVFQDGVYTEGGGAYVKRKVQQNLEPTEISQHLVNEVIGHVQRSTARARARLHPFGDIGAEVG
jgi:myosin-crossreactive antigen